MVGIVINAAAVFLTTIYLGLVGYMRMGWLRNKGLSPLAPMPKTVVSIIIAARNEQDNIGRTIDQLLAQDFPREQVEIIIVDDHSTDQTASIVRRYSDHGVHLIQLQEGSQLNSYKKLAIARAIDQARGELIITTDADCRMGTAWLKTVVSFFEENNAYMVSSPVLYNEEKSFFERLQTLEFLYLIGLGAAGIGLNKPTTCNGANLAYRRDVFYKMGGFRGIDNLASGDDELLLHKVAEQHADKIFFCADDRVVVFTDAKPNLASFISQRKRWASKSTKYKDKKVIALGVSIWLFNLFFIAALLQFLYALPTFTFLFPAIVVAKYAIEYRFMRPLCQFAQRPTLLLMLPLLTMLHPLYLVFIGFAGNIGKYEWKGRRVQ